MLNIQRHFFEKELHKLKIIKCLVPYQQNKIISFYFNYKRNFGDIQWLWILRRYYFHFKSNRTIAKVTKPISGRIRIWTHICLLPILRFLILELKIKLFIKLFIIIKLFLKDDIVSKEWEAWLNIKINQTDMKIKYPEKRNWKEKYFRWYREV